MGDIIIQIIITLAFSAFFSGMEIAFVSSNKLRFELEKVNSNITSHILSIFYRRPNDFISTQLVGNNIALVIYGILMAELIEQNLLKGIIENEFLLVLSQTIISTLIVLLTGEFMPKTLGVEDGDQAAENADVKHIILNLFILGKEEKREKGDIGATDIDKPTVTQHSCLIHGIRRNIDFQEVKQKTNGQQGKQNNFLCDCTSAAQKIVQANDGAGA